nr:MAG TPA: Gemin6 6 [Caudoviricetes sp.]
MVTIKDDWFGKKARIVAVNDKTFTGAITDITGKEDNIETNKDSLTLYDGTDYIFISDDEIKEIEILG